MSTIIPKIKRPLRYEIQRYKKELDDTLNLYTFVLLEYAELDFTADNTKSTKIINCDSVDNIFDCVIIPSSNIKSPDLWSVGRYVDNNISTIGELTYIGSKTLSVRITASLALIGVDSNMFVLNIFKNIDGISTAIDTDKGARIINTPDIFNRISIEVNTEIKKNDIITARITSLASKSSISVPFINAHLSIQPLKLVYTTSYV